MTKLTKISGVSAALILIVLDVFAIINSFALSGIYMFNNFINYLVPCGLLLGSALLAGICEKPFKKSLSITTLVLFSITLLIRIFAIVLFVLELIHATYLPPMSYIEYMELAEYSAFVLLAVAVIFLMLYFSKGKFEKTTLVLGGISCVSLLVVWAINMYNLISEAVGLSFGILQIFIEVYNSGLLRDIFTVLAYSIVFWVITELNKEKEKA